MKVEESEGIPTQRSNTYIYTCQLVVVLVPSASISAHPSLYTKEKYISKKNDDSIKFEHEN